MDTRCLSELELDCLVVLFVPSFAAVNRTMVYCMRSCSM
jgi:hypothetical protein